MAHKDRPALSSPPKGPSLPEASIPRGIASPPGFFSSSSLVPRVPALLLFFSRVSPLFFRPLFFRPIFFRPLFFLFLLFLFGCGVKTHPYPEMVTLPAKVLDLTREQDDKGYLTLSWRAPELNMAGGPLRELSHFEIWEASYPLEDFCEGCPSNYKKAGELALRPAPPGLRFSPKPYFWSEKLRENMVYRLRVAGFSGRGGVHPQAWTELTVYSLTPPGVLLGLKAEEDDLSVRISFERPEPWERAEIWRRAGSGPWEALILTQDNEYLDLSVSYGNTYAYRGRKTIPRGESLVPGPYSEVILVSVEDRVPLRPIAYLDASISPEGALLNWESMADDPQFKGYRLYRRLGPDDKFKALGGLLSQNSYLDKDAPPDREVRYIVTSVDNSPAANESLPSREAFLFTEEAPQPLPRPEL